MNWLNSDGVFEANRRARRKKRQLPIIVPSNDTTTPYFQIHEPPELTCDSCGVIDIDDILHGDDGSFHCLHCDGAVSLLTSTKTWGTSAVGWEPMGGPSVVSDRMMNGARSAPRTRPYRNAWEPRLIPSAPVCKRRADAECVEAMRVYFDQALAQRAEIEDSTHLKGESASPDG